MDLILKLNSKATWTRVVILFFTSAVLGTLIITMFFGRIELNPDATMDPLTFYTSETFFNNLDRQGETGRRSYLLLHLFDYIFITQFYLMFSYLIGVLMSAVTVSRTLSYLSLIPLFAATMDLLENLFIDISILLYPTKITALGSASGVFTFLKVSSLYVTFTVIICFLVFMLLRRVRK